MIFVELTNEPINVADLISKLYSNSAGAVSTFIGTTRDTFPGMIALNLVDGQVKKVVSLKYESFESMAEKEIYKIIEKSRIEYSNLLNIAVVHRLGDCPVGQISVFIGASSPHRRDAIRAVEYLIEQLKKSVPIWKKEYYSDGSEASVLFRRQSSVDSMSTTEIVSQQLATAVQNLQKMIGLQTWSTYSKSFRELLRKDPKGGIYTSINNKTVLTTTDYVNYLLPLIIFVSIMVGLLVITFITACGSCFCCKKCCTGRKRNPYGWNGRIFCFLLYLGSFAGFLVFVLCALGGNFSFTYGLNGLFHGITSLITDSQYTVGNLSLVINGTFDSFVSGANNLSASMSSTLQNAVSTQQLLVDTSNTVISRLDRMNGFNESIFSQGAAIDATITPIQALVNSFLTNVATINTKMSELNGNIQDYSNPIYTFTLITKVSFSNIIYSPAANGLQTNPLKILNQLKQAQTSNNIGSSYLISTIRTNVGTKLNNMQSAILTYSSTLGSGPVASALSQATSAQSSAKSTLSQLSSTLNSASATIPKTLQQFVDVEKWRSIGYAIYLAIPLVFLLFITFFFSFRKPKPMKYTSTIGLYVYIIAYIVGLAMMLVAVVIGEACTSFYNNNGAGINIVLNQFAPGVLNITGVMVLKEKCAGGQSVLNALGQSNLMSTQGSSSNGLNIQDLTAKFQNSFSSNNLVGALNLNSFLPSSDLYSISNYYTPSYMNAITNAISQMTATGGNSPYDTTNVPLISAAQLAAINTLKTTLTNLQSSATISSFGYTYPSITNTQKGYDLSKFQQMCGDLVTLIDATFTGANNYLTQIETIRASVMTSSTALSSTAANAVAFYTTVRNSVSTSIADLTNGVTAANANLQNSASSISSQFASTATAASNAAASFSGSLSNCTKIATDLDLIQTSTCTYLSGSMDALYLSFLCLALLGTISFPIFIGTANRCADRKSGIVDPALTAKLEPEDKAEKGLSKRKSQKSSKKGSRQASAKPTESISASVPPRSRGESVASKLRAFTQAKKAKKDSVPGTPLSPTADKNILSTAPAPDLADPEAAGIEPRKSASFTEGQTSDKPAELLKANSAPTDSALFAKKLPLGHNLELPKTAIPEESIENVELVNEAQSTVPETSNQATVQPAALAATPVQQLQAIPTQQIPVVAGSPIQQIQMPVAAGSPLMNGMPSPGLLHQQQVPFGYPQQYQMGFPGQFQYQYNPQFPAYNPQFIGQMDPNNAMYQQYSGQMPMQPMTFGMPGYNPYAMSRQQSITGQSPNLVTNQPLQQPVDNTALLQNLSEQAENTVDVMDLDVTMSVESLEKSSYEQVVSEEPVLQPSELNELAPEQVADATIPNQEEQPTALEQTGSVHSLAPKQQSMHSLRQSIHSARQPSVHSVRQSVHSVQEPSVHSLVQERQSSINSLSQERQPSVHSVKRSVHSLAQERQPSVHSVASSVDEPAVHSLKQSSHSLQQSAHSIEQATSSHSVHNDLFSSASANEANESEAVPEIQVDETVENQESTIKEAGSVMGSSFDLGSLF